MNRFEPLNRVATRIPRRTHALLRSLLLVLVLGCWPSVKQAEAAPEVDLHNLRWFVHIDLIEAGAGRDLAYWQGVIDDAMGVANLLLEGRQGPVDKPCCTRLARSVSVSTFGSLGDGLDIIDSAGEESAIAATGGSGSRAFLVDSLTWCGGPSAGAIGCSVRPSCNGNGNDNPSLWMTVTVDSLDDGTLDAVIGHERGHNACLSHVSSPKCGLMQGTVFTPGEGGCLAVSECTNYHAARTQTSSGLSCGCHDDSGELETDGSLCSDVANGICSGGVCGDYTGDASVHVLVAADPGNAALGPEDMIRISGLSGDWTVLGQIGPTAEDVRALAYAADSNTLYGVIPTVANDSVVTIDVATGALIAVVGTLANGSDEIVSMAYDPGATNAPSDDRLLVLEAGANGEIRAIDPASPSTTTLLGTLPFGSPELFTGLANDSIQDRLFMATPFGPTGFFEVDLASCPPSPCTTSALDTWAPAAFRENASLGYSATTGMLYLVGNLFNAPDTQTFYTVIDPTDGTVFETLSLDRFTPAGLAVVPEPGLVIGITAGVLGLSLTLRGNYRRCRRSTALRL